MEYEYSPGKKFSVTEETLEKTPHTFYRSGGMYENNSVNYFYDLVKMKHQNKNAVIIDVGAQSGLYSLYGKFIPESRIYAFEPFKDSYKCLCDNLQLNNITNVEAINCALGSSNENKILKVPEHRGLNTLGDQHRFSDWNNHLVQVLKLDDILLHTVSSVDYIKCDTEGWEYHVLKGAEECIRKWKPELFIEINSANTAQCSLEIEYLVEYLKSLNYSAVTIKDIENVHFTYKE
jgi:FkbM family methyltransferase